MMLRTYYSIMSLGRLIYDLKKSNKQVLRGHPPPCNPSPRTTSPNFQVTVKLVKPVVVTHVTLEQRSHVMATSDELLSAPKLFQVP